MHSLICKRKLIWMWIIVNQMHIEEVILRVWNSRQGAEQWRMPGLRGSRKNHPWGQKVESEGQRRALSLTKTRKLTKATHTLTIWGTHHYKDWKFYTVMFTCPYSPPELFCPTYFSIHYLSPLFFLLTPPEKIQIDKTMTASAKYRLSFF